MFAEILNDNRAFYMCNNAESELYELSRYIEKNKLLEQENENLCCQLNGSRAEIASLKEIIATQVASASKAVSPNDAHYLHEIEQLNKTIAALNDRLADQKSELQELYRLRELAFELQDDMAESEEEPKSIENLLSNKSVVLIGGHINIRNKLSQLHKSLIVLDGHSPNVDKAIIENADIVIFNTSSMSHSLYYKVIEIVRGKNVRFDYLHKSTNVTLIESQIIRILKKHFY